MCGRFTVAQTVEDLVTLWSPAIVAREISLPNYNIRPTDTIPILVDTATQLSGIQGSPNAISTSTTRRLEAARWSLIPSFAADKKLPYPTFNARSETITTKRSFRDSVVNKRCLIPADGYYEWLTEPDLSKRPFYIRSADGETMAFAGLYSWWADPTQDRHDSARWVLSATILTMQAPKNLAHIHERSPVILPSHAWDTWLNPHVRGDVSLVDRIVASAQAAAQHTTHYEVAPLRGTGPELIQPL
ncbi:SOS response-associated peptidase [Lysinibacter sp. HNR]|uniref:SOS response-associated peptidase n=1 Tax=Lysinibacter sp. HNR TaxID=3031408 RepID=UPI002435EB98|nr:SOS response-associated peptidase [Lysinibacter sp. HNR]WGD38290.1 SOS response-associated peptidase [Lysinibacter sp. HNR]